MTWQKRARLVIVLSAVAFAVVVAFAFKRRNPTPASIGIVRTDPKAVVESTKGIVRRFNRADEEVRIEFDRQLTYEDGTTKLLGIKVFTGKRGGRSFTVSGNEGQAGQQESSYIINGDVRLEASDGFTAKTAQATYSENDGIVRSPGPVAFGNGRMSGSGVGMIYDKNADVVTIIDQAVVRMAPDEHGMGASDATAGVAFFGRREKIIRFERGMTVNRTTDTITAENGIVHLSPDEKRVESLELHNGARVLGNKPAPGGLQELSGRDLALKYGAEGQGLEHALVTGDGLIRLAGGGTAGRQITGNLIDVTFAPDGATPTALAARESVQLTLPAEADVPARTVKAATLDSSGEPSRGLTKATFNGNVEYRERSASVDRVARSARLDASLKPGFASIDAATFTGNAQFNDSKIVGNAASIKYGVDAGALELTGSEPASPVPHVANDQIDVNATKINVTLAGPVLNATTNVKSVLKPSKPESPQQRDAKEETRLPSMLKQDQPVTVTAQTLAYDGAVSKATYTGAAQLWQIDTSIKGDTIVLDDKTGDMSASGSVVTTAMLVQENKDKKKERVRTVGTSKDFKYEDDVRRATYTGEAHLAGTQSDLTAQKIELYLKPGGEELERAEGYEDVTLREQNRKTTGARLTYTAVNETYVVTGAPVIIVDDCGRETTGATLTFVRGTDTIVMDGNERGRTRTKSGSKGGDKCQ